MAAEGAEEEEGAGRPALPAAAPLRGLARVWTAPIPFKVFKIRSPCPVVWFIGIKATGLKRCVLFEGKKNHTE